MSIPNVQQKVPSTLDCDCRLVAFNRSAVIAEETLFYYYFVFHGNPKNILFYYYFHGNSRNIFDCLGL